MDFMLIQNVLAARRNDGSDGWMQLLVFVVMGVLYAIATITKAKSNKKALEEDEHLEEIVGEEDIEKLRPRPLPSEQITDRQPAPQPILRPPQPQVVEQEPLPIEDLKEAKKITRETVMQLRKPLIKLGTSIEPEELIEELKLELDDRENLRKAILYREILGKPTGLRNE